MNDAEFDAQVRRLAADDTSRPSETVRRAILAEAERVAARARLRRWRPAAVGSLAAAGLAGLIMFPLLRENVTAPRQAPGYVSQPDPAVEEAVVTAPKRARTLRAEPPRPLPSVAAPAAPAGSPIGSPRQVQALAESAALHPPADAVSPLAGAAFRAKSDAAPLGPALLTAAAQGDLASLRRLLGATSGVASQDIDARDEHGRTALMLAVDGDRVDAVELLLSHGADPNALDADGQTALTRARAAADARLLQLLDRTGTR